MRHAIGKHFPWNRKCLALWCMYWYIYEWHIYSNDRDISHLVVNFNKTHVFLRLWKKKIKKNEWIYSFLAEKPKILTINHFGLFFCVLLTGFNIEWIYLFIFLKYSLCNVYWPVLTHLLINWIFGVIEVSLL